MVLRTPGNPKPRVRSKHGLGNKELEVSIRGTYAALQSVIEPLAVLHWNKGDTPLAHANASAPNCHETFSSQTNQKVTIPACFASCSC